MSRRRQISPSIFPITDKLGERMKSARESRGYTREQLSKRGLALSANFIFPPEQDINDPQLDHLIKET